MKSYFLILMILVFVGCSKSNYELNSLKNYKVFYKDLPQEVILYLKNPSGNQSDIQKMLVELPVNEKANYSLETVSTFVKSWVSYEKLIDIDKNISYKIEQGVPDPYIVFENKLYVPDKFNILTTACDLDKVEFTCYELK